MIVIGADPREEVISLTTAGSQDQNPGTVKIWNAIIATIRVTLKFSKKFKADQKKVKKPENTTMTGVATENNTELLRFLQVTQFRFVDS